MLARVYSVAHLGLETVLIEVEVDVASRGFPTFNIVGLPNKAVEEAKERVKTAIVNSNLSFPDRRIVVNLAPADLPKEGACYDLPIAVGILLASGQIGDAQLDLEKSLFYGELALDGGLRPTKGVFPLAHFAAKQDFTSLFVPVDSAVEGAYFPEIKVFPLRNLFQLINHFTGIKPITPLNKRSFADLINDQPAEFDMAEIIGQFQAKRALTIAAAGGHNVFLRGVPGAGKTMLARALPGIMPPLSEGEALEVTKIYSLVGKVPPEKGLITTRPFRAPHHTISRVGLIGGGTRLQPGEITLAHRGVLFLDEFPEFPRHVLEALRQPMEDGIVSVVRAAGSVVFPARFLLVAAANPCPCGFLGHPTKPCRCLPGQIYRYRRRLSGPIMDRIDIHLEIPPVEVEKLSQKHSGGESSLKIRQKVIEARARQHHRFKKTKLNILTNSELTSQMVKKLCRLTPQAETLLTQAARKLSLSARAYFKVIKVAQTIADLNGEDQISSAAIAEALQYRPKEEG